MPRIARVVVPGLPHHIVQRGNRRLQTFFCTEDYLHYRSLMSEWCARCGVEIWAYCLMPNHAHLIAVPESEDALRRAIGQAHREYSRDINLREGWRGYLWQGRFISYAMDERHTVAAARYIELNPVRAGLVAAPSEYAWSSARAHLLARDDKLVRVAPLLGRIDDWGAFLRERPEPEMVDVLRKHGKSGLPLGTDAFVQGVEAALDRGLSAKRAAPVMALGEGGWAGGD